MKKKIQIIAEIANSHQGCSLQAFNLASFAKLKIDKNIKNKTIFIINLNKISVYKFIKLIVYKFFY